jgi:hypothetical protein
VNRRGRSGVSRFHPCYLCVSVLVAAVILRPLFALIERESLARQAARDDAAEDIMTCLRRQQPTPPYSLYLRPFKTTGLLASNTVGSSVVPGQEAKDADLVIYCGCCPMHCKRLA